MTDLEMFKKLLKKADASFSSEKPEREEYITRSTATIIRVMPGYRAHFEACFDKKGNIENIGQWEDM
jgi:hypothetical protein